jgi:hypothetical protein
MAVAVRSYNAEPPGAAASRLSARPPDVMKNHTIRLGSAWEHSAAGAVWTRHFGRPGGLGPEDRVLLVIVPRAAAAVSLNAAALPRINAGGGPWRHEITPLLRDRNTLVLTPGPPVAPAALDSATGNGHGRMPLPDEIGDVSLEIILGSE